jgi:hypothetical protein
MQDCQKKIALENIALHNEGLSSLIMYKESRVNFVSPCNPYLSLLLFSPLHIHC